MSAMMLYLIESLTTNLRIHETVMFIDSTKIDIHEEKRNYNIRYFAVILAMRNLK